MKLIKKTIMKGITNFTKGITCKLYLITVFTFIGFNDGIQAQKDLNDSIANQGLVYHTKKPGETDWEFLKRTDRYLPKGWTAVTKNKGKLDRLRILDEVYKNKMQLAEAFLDNYPQDEHYDEAMRMLFYENFHPYFISKKIPDSLAQHINSLGKDGATIEEILRASRAIPIDEQAKAKYIKKTNDLVASILKSNSSMERKYKAEFMLLCRDFIAAHRIKRLMPKYSKLNAREAEYWERADIQFWDSFRLRIETLLSKYGTLKVIATDFRIILNNIADYSPGAAYFYWKYFADSLAANNPNTNQVGIIAFHKLATDFVAAKEALKKTDGTKPLEMVFTAMDGREIDLNKMRGKVVLIDFWGIGCPPCIKEMPHVKALYDKYRNQGFEVIGIEGSGNEKKVREILEKTGADWPQYLEGGFDAPISYLNLYNITSFPTVWLLNKEGQVVDKNARGQRLEPLIRKYLGLEKVNMQDFDKKAELIAKIKKAEKDLNWKDYANYSIDFVKSYLQNDNKGLNYFAWKFYENDAIIAPKVLNEALGWVNQALKNGNEYSILDTKAALLFKLGRKKEAIIAANNAMEFANKNGDDPSSTVALLEKIKAN